MSDYDHDSGRLAADAVVDVDLAVREPVLWRAHWSVEKFHGDSTDPAQRYERLESDGNLLMFGGASCLWQCLIGNGTATADQTLTFFNNARAALGVGDSSAAEAATQTDLQAASNKLRKAMDATYPQHTDATTSGAATVTYRATFATTDANFVWSEWGTFNSATAATGRMLNRKVAALGTKTSAATWQLTVTLTLA